MAAAVVIPPSLPLHSPLDDALHELAARAQLRDDPEVAAVLVALHELHLRARKHARAHAQTDINDADGQATTTSEGDDGTRGSSLSTLAAYSRRWGAPALSSSGRPQ